MPVTTYKLTAIAQAVQVATILTQSWFRGHSRVIGELTPRIFRPEHDDELLRAFRPTLEMAMIDAFKREAPALAEIPMPAEEDSLGWLYVMQHYRTPTRLLDWTKNVLVGLYFAVSADHDVDGELWALYPTELNQLSHVGFGMPLVGKNPVLQFLIDQPYWAGSPEALAQKLGMELVPNRPVAFEPSRRFARLVRQAGAFTIHPRPEPGHTILEILSDERHIVRYLVPAAAKRKLRDELAVLGVDDYALFPELEGLSKRIVNEARVVAYSPPTPPKCDGPVE